MRDNTLCNTYGTFKSATVRVILESAIPPDTSLTIFTPASTAARATSEDVVSMERRTSSPNSLRIRSIVGTCDQYVCGVSLSETIDDFYENATSSMRCINKTTTYSTINLNFRRNLGSVRSRGFGTDIDDICSLLKHFFNTG